jgi:hypothetical protein
LLILKFLRLNHYQLNGVVDSRHGILPSSTKPFSVRYLEKFD